MAYVKYSGSNKAKAQLAAPLTASATSIILKAGQGALFPQPSTDWPFKLLMEKYNSLGVCTAREIARVTARSTDTLTAVRLDEFCPASDAATTQTKTAQSFAIDDWVYCVFSDDTMVDIQDEVTRLNTAKLNAVGGLRTGLTASRLTLVDGSGNETYATPGAANTFLADDLTFKSINSLPFVFGDGSDGALVISSGTTNLNLNQVYNYSSISISVGATLSTAGTDGEMRLKCSGLTTLSGTINLVGKNTSPLAIASTFGDIPALALGAGGAGGKGGRTTLGGNGGTSSTPYGAGGGGGGSDWAGTYNGGVGGNGGTPIGTGGTAGSASNGGNGGTSAGGGGAGANWPTAGGAGGGGAYGTAGVNSPNVSAAGGGGAGGTFGNSGANLKLHTSTITGTGTINTSGSVGGNGGKGGDTGTSNNAGGGGGGGGGAGGCGGHIQIIVASWSVFAGTATRAGAAGGTGGVAGAGSSSNAVAGSNGTAGSSGTLVNSLQRSIIY